MFKLTLPDEDGFYTELVKHPKVVRVVALSGGYSRDEANAKLARNPGVIAQLLPALTEGLTAQQSDAEFDALLDTSIQSIFDASSVRRSNWFWKPLYSVVFSEPVDSPSAFEPGALAADAELDRDLARRPRRSSRRRTSPRPCGRRWSSPARRRRARRHALSNCSCVRENTSLRIVDLVGVQRPLAVEAEDLRAGGVVAEALRSRAPSRTGPSITCRPLARPAMRIFMNT